MQTNRPSHAKAMSDLIKSRLLSENIPPRQRAALMRNLARYELQQRQTLQPARPQSAAYGPPTGPGEAPDPNELGGGGSPLGGGVMGSSGPPSGAPASGPSNPRQRYVPGANQMAPNLLAQVRPAQQMYEQGAPAMPRMDQYQQGTRQGQAYGLQNRMQQMGVSPDQQQEMAALSDDPGVQEVVDMPEWATRMQQPGFQSEVRAARIKAVKKMIRDLVNEGDAPPEAAYLSDAALGMYFSDPDIIDDLMKRKGKKKDAR